MADSNTVKQSGHFELKGFNITSFDKTKKVDIRFLVHSFNIVESMSASAITGSAIVYDTADLVTTFPLKCEETIDITYSDFYDIERTDTFFLYAITDVKYVNLDDQRQAILSYMIHFTSITKALSEDKRIAKAYKNGTVSTYVKEVFDEYYDRPAKAERYKVKNIIIEETSNPKDYVIPRLTPDQTMMFFSRKAFSARYTTQTYRFFEARDNFYFAPNEYFFDRLNPSAQDPRPNELNTSRKSIQIPKYSRNYLADFSAARQASAMREIIDIDFGIKVNTMDDINMGGYKRSAWEVDIINGVVTKYAYDHLNEFKGDKETLTHDRQFIDRRMTKEKERFIIKDYIGSGRPATPALTADPYYVALHNRKVANFHHYEKNKIALSVYGQNKLFAGSIIELELFKHTSATDKIEKDKERSGIYIVEKIENVFHENNYVQKLVVSRGGLGK